MARLPCVKHRQTCAGRLWGAAGRAHPRPSIPSVVSPPMARQPATAALGRSRQSLSAFVHPVRGITPAASRGRCGIRTQASRTPTELGRRLCLGLANGSAFYQTKSRNPATAPISGFRGISLPHFRGRFGPVDGKDRPPAGGCAAWRRRVRRHPEPRTRNPRPLPAPSRPAGALRRCLRRPDRIQHQPPRPGGYPTPGPVGSAGGFGPPACQGEVMECWSKGAME